MAESEEERHDDGCGDRADGFDEAAKRVAAKGDLFGESGDGEREEIEKKQTEGTRLGPEVDVQGSGQRHRKDGENDEAPAECGAKCPFAPCGGTLRADRGLRGGGLPVGDGLQDGKTECQQEEQKDGGEQRAGGVDGEVLGEAACGACGDGIGGEKPGDGGDEECKLQRALGTACGCRIERVQR